MSTPGIIFDWVPKPKEWYDALPPLVRKGEDRETVLQRLVTGWTTEVGEHRPDEHIQAITGKLGYSPVIEGVAFVDENELDSRGHPLPIDLGDILRRIEKTQPATGPRRHLGGGPANHIVLRGCRIDECNCRQLGNLPHCIFVGVRFGAGADFSKTQFGPSAIFEGCGFGTATRFDEANFGDFSRFTKCNCAGLTSFHGTSFGAISQFSGSHFGDGVSFIEARFGHMAKFVSTRFGRLTQFKRAIFGRDVVFEGASFEWGATFLDAGFLGRVNFAGARFGPGSGISRALVSTEAPLLRVLSKKKLRKSLAWYLRWLDWHHIREIGGVTALTRVSYAALLAVPILAGMWNWLAPMIGYEHPPKFPMAWGLAFFAAVCVFLGHLIFQTRCPRTVQEHSREEFVAMRKGKWTTSPASEQRDLLQLAFESTALAARTTPWKRHRCLVYRHGETVWIPSSLLELDTTKKADAPIPRHPHVSELDVWSRTEGGVDDEKLAARFSSEELRHVLVDEGAAAEYDVLTRRAARWCAASAFFYATAAVLLAWLTVSQAVAVLAAIFMPQAIWSKTVHQALGVVGLTALILSAAASVVVVVRGGLLGGRGMKPQVTEEASLSELLEPDDVAWILARSRLTLQASRQ